MMSTSRRRSGLSAMMRLTPMQVLLVHLVYASSLRTSISMRNPTLAPMHLRGGVDEAIGEAEVVGTEAGVNKLKSVMEAACDRTQTADQQAAAKASLLEMVSDNWSKLPKEKQADLKRFAVQQIGTAAGVVTSEDQDVRDVSMKVALGVATKLVPSWGESLKRMSDLVADVSGAQSGVCKAERMIREAIEVSWAEAAGTKVVVEGVSLPSGKSKELHIKGFHVLNPPGTLDWSPEEAAVSFDSFTVEPAVDLLDIMGGDVIIVERVCITGLECHLQIANVSNFFKKGRTMSNLQTIHEHLTLFNEGVGGKGVRKSPLQSLMKVVGSALKIPPLSMAQDARVVVRKVELKGTVFTLGATFMNDGRFSVRIPDAVILDVGQESKGGVRPDQIGEAIWGSIMRDLLSKVSVFKFAGTHELGNELSTAVRSMLRDVKGGSAAVKERVSLMLREAAQAVREELLGEGKKPDDAQQEARDRFYDEDETWRDEDERLKKLHEDYDPIYPPEVDAAQAMEELKGQIGGAVERIALDFERGFNLSKGKGEAAK